MEGLSSISRDYRSLMKRTVEERLYNELRQDYGFPRAICRSPRDLFYSYLNLYLGTDRTDGQLVFRAVPYDCPPGVKTEEIKTRSVRLTLFSMEDVPVASRSTSELTEQRIVRITHEALDQGGLLTQADLALLLGESPRTIGRRIRILNETCRFCPPCDLLIARRNELEQQLAAAWEERDPRIVGNEYMVLGTVDRADWRRAMREEVPTEEAIRMVHPFEDLLDIKVDPGGWRFRPDGE